jgi:hypothetical protein
MEKDHKEILSLYSQLDAKHQAGVKTWIQVQEQREQLINMAQANKQFAQLLAVLRVCRLKANSKSVFVSLSMSFASASTSASASASASAVESAPTQTARQPKRASPSKEENSKEEKTQPSKRRRRSLYEMPPGEQEEDDVVDVDVKEALVKDELTQSQIQQSAIELQAQDHKQRQQYQPAAGYKFVPIPLQTWVFKTQFKPATLGTTDWTSKLLTQGRILKSGLECKQHYHVGDIIQINFTNKVQLGRITGINRMGLYLSWKPLDGSFTPSKRYRASCPWINRLEKIPS